MPTDLEARLRVLEAEVARLRATQERVIPQVASHAAELVAVTLSMNWRHAAGGAIDESVLIARGFLAAFQNARTRVIAALTGETHG